MAMAQPASKLWAVTAYFNPCGYQNRYQNYRVFRERLDIPLAVAELSFNGEFELQDDDAEIVLRIDEGDFLWQRERLVNLALAAVPADCTKVAWVDADIVFDDPDWVHRTDSLLDEFLMVQPFHETVWLDAQQVPGQREPLVDDHIGRSTAFHLVTERQFAGDPGFCWAFQRPLLAEHGWYDGCVVGGADRLLVCAALGWFDQAIEWLAMGPQWAAHYRRWAEPFFETVQSRITYTDGRLFTLWHGSFADRAYRDRHKQVAKLDYDPETDLRLSEQGCWLWNSAKPDLHDYVRSYFESRREDG